MDGRPRSHGRDRCVRPPSLSPFLLSPLSKSLLRLSSLLPSYISPLSPRQSGSSHHSPSAKSYFSQRVRVFPFPPSLPPSLSPPSFPTRQSRRDHHSQGTECRHSHHGQRALGALWSLSAHGDMGHDRDPGRGDEHQGDKPKRELRPSPRGLDDGDE